MFLRVKWSFRISHIFTKHSNNELVPLQLRRQVNAYLKPAHDSWWHTFYIVSVSILFMFCVCSTFSRHSCTETEWSFSFLLDYCSAFFFKFACKCHCIYCIFCKENVTAVCLLQLGLEVGTVKCTSINI